MKVQKELSDSERDIIEDEPIYRYVKIFIGFLLIIIVGVVGYYLDKTFALSNFVTKITGVQKTSTSQSRGVRIAKIQDVQVGERAIGLNPELDDDDDRDLFTPHRVPHPIDWRKLTLEMIKPDGKRLDITLLRPLYWIFESKAEIGATIFLDLPEMGAQGIAKVLNIEPCPPIKPGKGNIITGTFHHEAANTIDVHVEGLSKPIGTTDNHPFWSVTRNEFVEAGKLRPGEQLQLYNGQTAKVIQILPRPGPERVHNLEVMNEHVYRVSEQGVLVHNNCSEFSFKSAQSIRFTQNSISNQFRNETTVRQLVDDLKTGRVKPENLPAIRVFEMDGKLYSLDNRRLFACQEANVPIKVRNATKSEIESESWKITTENDGISIEIRGGL